MLFALVSCDKEEVAITDSTKVTEKEILTFATQEEFEQTLAKVNAMTKEERLLWEKEQGFKSFGTICDEFYESIDFESLKSIDMLKILDTNKLLKIYTYEKETIIEPIDIDAKERFLMNKNKMYIVSNMVFKIVDSKQISTRISHIEALYEINSFNDFLSHPIFNAQLKQNSSLRAKQSEYINKEVTRADGKYMTKVNYQTENYWASFPTRTQIEVEFTIKNYKKAWIGYKLEKLNTDYVINLEAFDESGRLSTFWTCNGAAIGHQLDNYNKTEKYDIVDGWTNSYATPKFSSVSGWIESPAGRIDIE